MSGLPQGSSPRLSGVMHFLAQQEHPVAKAVVPRSVRPIIRWESSLNEDVKLSDLKPDDAVCVGFAEMINNCLDEIDGWSDTEKIHIDATFTDDEGNESNHCFMVNVEVSWDAEVNKFGISLAMVETEMSADELAFSLHKIWGD